jgi:sphingomyelin phosphodiesterase acid-like 3
MRIRFGRVSFLISLALLFAGSGRAASSSQIQAGHSGAAILPNEGTFLILSDIHFDPFAVNDPSVIEELIAMPVENWPTLLEPYANQMVSADGADANYPLLTSALAAARNANVSYDYVVITGDFLAHNFPEKFRHYRPDGKGYQQFVIKTMAFVNRTVQQAFPAIPLYEAFGNNDSISDDYAEQGRPLLAAAAKEWKVLAQHPEARKDFLAGGYYAIPHPRVQSQEFLILNTVYWSNRYSSAGEDRGSLELAWLAAQLDSFRAKHKTAALLMHIPPGFDAYASAKPAQCSTPLPFWKIQYFNSFLAIMAAHKDLVRDGYAGHMHTEDFRVLTDSAGTPYFQVHIAPSISRDHHNNPGFEIGVYDKSTGALVDYAVTYMQNSPPEWKLIYDFRRESHLSNYSPASLQTATLLIRSSETVRKTLLDMFGGRTSAATIPLKDWRFYSCAQTEMSPGGYTACACPTPADNN